MKGYGLSSIQIEALVSSNKKSDRMKAARWGYGLHRLVNDKSISVRILVAKQGYGLDILIKDENELVRAEVAKKKYNLNILMHDKSPMVRMEVAAQGYALDYLAREDKDKDVREFARYKLKEKNRKEKSIGDEVLNNDEKCDFKTPNNNENLENER
jgi:intracellular sulfur oxidation DsrE/DsrF family protein